jgi:hypothetical protein
MTISPAWIASSAATRSRAGKALERCPRTPRARALSIRSGLEVPGLHHDVTGVRVADQDADLVVVGLWLSERVVEHDVDGV